MLDTKGQIKNSLPPNDPSTRPMTTYKRSEISKNDDLQFYSFIFVFVCVFALRQTTTMAPMPKMGRSDGGKRETNAQRLKNWRLASSLEEQTSQTEGDKGPYVSGVRVDLRHYIFVISPL